MARDPIESDFRVGVRPIHPLHAVLPAGAMALFLGGLLSDIGYARTYQVQWANFAAWLIAGAMVFAGLALLWSVIALGGRWGRTRWAMIGLVLLALTFVLGLINSFVHARDAWAMMPTGLVLSVVVFVLALAATWVGFFSRRGGEFE